MNSEILFKAKDINGDWHEGYVSTLKKDMSGVKAGTYISNKYGMPFAFQVDPSTVCIKTDNGEWKNINHIKAILDALFESTEWMRLIISLPTRQDLKDSIEAVIKINEEIIQKATQ